MRFPMTFSAAVVTGAMALALPAQAQDANTVMATVNGKEITLGHMIALQQRLPAQFQQYPDDVLFDGILQQLIQQELLAQQIDAEGDTTIGLYVDNEMRSFKAGQLLDRIASVEISDEEIQTMYDEQYAGQTGGAEWNASHILVESEDEANTLIETLNGGADFATLAKEKSTGPSGVRGGELGWFGAGMMVPEFEDALTEMSVGDISAPVQTQFGWHVIKMNEVREVAAPSLEDVRSDIIAEIQSMAVDTAIEAAQDGAQIVENEEIKDPKVIRLNELLLQK